MQTNPYYGRFNVHTIDIVLLNVVVAFTIQSQEKVNGCITKNFNKTSMIAFFEFQISWKNSRFSDDKFWSEIVQRHSEYCHFLSYCLRFNYFDFKQLISNCWKQFLRQL